MYVKHSLMQYTFLLSECDVAVQCMRTRSIGDKSE